MEAAKFEALLQKIVDFCSDAVIDISLWGETALHPQKIDIISAVLRRRELSLVIETSGIGWENGELEKIADIAKDAPPRKAAFPPALSWIVSLDSCDPAKYREIRGAGFTEANETAKKLLSLFPKNTYVQAVRTAGSEDDTERFYRYWKEQLSACNAEAAANIIIQKYDDFCEMLPHMQASDLSPVQRKPCWHIMRDMPVLIDGTVLLCRQQICQKENTAIRLGNAFCEDLETIWDRGKQYYEKHAAGAEYDPLCVKCDEYYTYNF
jgi:spiro-SPASM protein